MRKFNFYELEDDFRDELDKLVDGLVNQFYQYLSEEDMFYFKDGKLTCDNDSFYYQGASVSVKDPGKCEKYE